MSEAERQIQSSLERVASISRTDPDGARWHAARLARLSTPEGREEAERREEHRRNLAIYGE